MSGLIAEVLVQKHFSSLLSYEVPLDLVDKVVPGVHVDIPLGKTKSVGLVLKVERRENTEAFHLKSILTVQDHWPVVSASILDLIRWFALYYHTSFYKAYQTVIGIKKWRPLPPQMSQAQLLSTHTLTEEQGQAVLSILDRHPSRTLLQGVTGSGKTEVYLNIARRMLDQGKTVLMLLPEIALTPQMSTMFLNRFGQDVVILHSALTPKQRDVAYSKILMGQVHIVIGPRSAIFAPLENLGVIMIDEEHESTYKQDTSPRYFTHTVAAYRASYHGASLILGTATPSVEFRYKSDSQSEDGYQRVVLKKRVFDRPMPVVRIVDMKERFGQGLFSQDLIQAVEDRLAKKEKTIFLVNRRGYAPNVQCQACGTVLCCSHCKLGLTYHTDKTFRCHRCSTQQRAHNRCGSCQKNSLVFSGMGTQKVEVELKKRFADAVLVRLDRDTAKSAQDMERILDEFRNKADILVGTQMIAKGHHIEDVTLVGVLGIDSVLNIPDYKSPERTFQLLTQVAGRAGRGEKLGEVIVQTYQADHYAIQHASRHDDEGFFKDEVAFRQELSYPPFSDLIQVVLSSTSGPALQRYVKIFGAFVEANFAELEGVMFHGPVPAPIEQIRQHKRWHVVFKVNPDRMAEVKDRLFLYPAAPASVRVIIDIEAKSLL